MIWLLGSLALHPAYPVWPAPRGFSGFGASGDDLEVHAPLISAHEPPSRLGFMGGFCSEFGGSGVWGSGPGRGSREE